MNHSGFSDLLSMLFAFWAVQRPEEAYSSFGRCLLEKPKTQTCALASNFALVATVNQKIVVKAPGWLYSKYCRSPNLPHASATATI